MRLRDAAKWIKEKITGKKAEETPVLTPMIATEEDIERAKKMDREIEEMEKKSALMAPVITSQAEMERLKRFEAGSKQIAEMTGKPHEEVAEAILKVTTETSASLEEATEQVRERMELQAEVAAETKEESDTPFVQRWAEALGMTVQELEQQTGWTAEQLEQNIIDSSRIITTELVKAQRLMKRDKSSVLGSAHSDSSGSRSTGTVHRRDDPVLPLPAKGRQDKKRVHREAEKGRRRTDSGNQGNAGKERRKASEKAAKKE